jgi:hypothetical protein
MKQAKQPEPAGPADAKEVDRDVDEGVPGGSYDVDPEYLDEVTQGEQQPDGRR